MKVAVLKILLYSGFWGNTGQECALAALTLQEASSTMKSEEKKFGEANFSLKNRNTYKWQ